MTWQSAQQCDRCWHAEQGDRAPHRLVQLHREITPCVDCGRRTSSGIYVRRDIPEASQ